MDAKTVLSTMVAAAVAIVASAENLTVADDYSVSVTASGTISVATPTFQVDGQYPSDAPQPYFWFDASDTTGWEFTTYGGNANCVSKIPSKDGSKLAGIRYLSNKDEDVHRATTPTSGDGDEWYGWWGTDKQTETNLMPMRPPVYVTDDPTLVGGKCVDFLSYGSLRALRFNNYMDEGCTVASNALRNIGTVIAVYGSHAGGGWFLGGGGNGSFIRWHRAAGDQEAEANWMNPVLRDMGNSWALGGILRHDGLETSPTFVGFNRGWEVLGWQFTSAGGMTFGPGIGDGRGYGWQRTGGQKIAEMIFFDAVLEKADIEKVEAYLQKKWFGRTFAGRNGAAHLASLSSTANGNDAFAAGVATELAVGAGESLAVDRVVGGRGADARIRKTGAGALRLGDATGYAGSLELVGGTLDYPAKRTIPTVSELPRDCWAHFDPSNETSLHAYEEDGTLWFNGLDNLAGTKKYDSSAKAWYDFYLRNFKSRRCWVRMNALGEGLNVVDMGNASNDGRYLCFAADAPGDSHDVSKETAMSGITTYIAVYSARGSGGHYAKNAMYVHSTKSVGTYSGWFRTGLLGATKVGNQQLAGTNGVMYIDGERVDPVNGRLRTAGFQIVAIQTSGYDAFTRLGVSTDNDNMGGQMLGELFLYRRPLSETEIKDVSAYLAKKWLGREIVGYTTDGSRTRTAADLHRIDATGTANVQVASGETIRVGALTVPNGGALGKTGAGTLVAETADVKGSVEVAAGDLKVVGPLATATTSEIAADPFAWFDPTDRTRMNVETSGSDEYVAQWYDKKLVHTFATHSDARRPQLKTDAVSGNAYLDTLTGRFMYLEKAIDSARSVYVIWRTKNNATLAQMFGTMGDSAGIYKAIDPDPDILDGLRGEDKNAAGEYYLFRDSSRSPFAMGAIYTNGVKVSRKAIPTTDAFELIEVHMSAPAHIAAIANDRSWNTTGRLGGSDFGDILIYDRELTAHEKVATRNYLMKKWFNRDPEPLPPAEVTTGDVRSLSVAADATATFETPVAVGDLSGKGSLALEADASVVDVSACSGTVAVAAGKTLALPKAPTPVAPQLVTEGLLAQFDASDETTVTIADGTTAGVAEWRSKVGGWAAVSGKKYITNKTNYNPTYRTVDKGLDGKRAVELAGNTIMLFEQGGVTNDIPGIKSAFWVLGTAGMGGGFFLGGGRRTADLSGSREYVWHRGGANAGAYAGSVGDPLTCGSAAASVKDARWYLNGELVDGKTVGLRANEWFYMNCNFRTDDSAVSASGFAFDGRILEGQWDTFAHRSGHQILAEVLLYDHVLDDDERQAVEAYLAAKWGFVQKGTAGAATVDLAAGATLDCGGHVQKLASLSGSGSVVNGSLALGTLVADGAVTAWPRLASCTIADGQVVELKNIPADPVGTSVKILSAAAFEGSENLRSAVFTGDVPDSDKIRTRLRIEGNDLVVTFKPKGMLLLVR